MCKIIFYFSSTDVFLEKWKDHRLVATNIFLQGYVVQGSNGEFAYMDPGERIELVKKVREFASKEKLIIAGAACEGICCGRETI